jgi:uncharacterized repeat protein (TIGR01451 family)
MNPRSYHTILRLICGSIALALFGLIAASPAAAAYTLTPNAWNTVGLDSNTPAFGPYHFPVGAKVCGGTNGASDTATFVWDAGGTDNGTYIYLRSGSASPVTITFGADGCADAYFEVEVNRTSAAFDQTRRYHITSGGGSTPVPRELYVEHLVSQSRNGIDNVKLNSVSVPAGGAMNLTVGNTYTIELDGHTAPGGYNQFEEFINFPNTVFQVLSVSTSYTADTSPYVTPSNAYPYLYADACGWENDPNSPYYRSCVGGDYKTGDTVITTYTVKILSGGGTSSTLNSLLYDFSGSSFHYNADYSTGARIANIIDPTSVTISKSFSPSTTNAGSVSTLIFSLTNPNAGAVSGLNFTDIFPTSPGAMTLSDTVTTNTCGGALTDNSGAALAIGSAGITLSNGTVAANSSCTIQVDVTVPTNGIYTNISNHLFAGSVDTGHFASAALTVNNTPVPPAPSSSCPSPVTLAQWNFDNLAAGANSTPAYSSKAVDVATATAGYTGAGASDISNASSSSAPNAWSGTGWAATNTGFPSGTTPPYFEFVLDTSKYGGVGVSFNYELMANGDWANPGNNFLYVYANANGGAFSQILPTVTAPKGTPFNVSGQYPAAATGTGTTAFRMNVVGAQKAASLVYLDNVTFTGCTRPDPTKLTLTKSFSVSPVAVNGTSTLSFTISNLNSTSTSTLTGISFTDTLVTGMTVTTGSSVQCGGTLTKTAPSAISLTGGTLAPGATCTLTATITATTAGPHNNVSGFIYSSQTGTNTSSTGVAKASLAAVLPPVISKQFSRNPILANGVSTLTFLLTNPNQNDALSGVAFSDTFPTSPGNMVVANPPSAATSGCGAPTFSPAAGAGSITFSGGAIAAGGTCIVTVNATAPVQSQPATIQSITDDTHLTLGSTYGSTASGLTISKNLTSAATGTVSVTNGSATVTGTGTKFTTELSVGSIIYIGTYRNTSGVVSATTAGNGNTATDTLTVSQSHPAITLFKEDASTNTASTLWDYYLALPVGGSVYYRFQVQNDGDVPLTSASVTDADLPAPLTMASCSWKDGDGNSLTSPFTLQVANNSNNADFAVCIIGPVTVASPGSYTNNASATGYNGATPYTDTDWAMYATTNLSLVTSVTPTYFTAAGNAPTYSYAVTNNGSAALTGPVAITITAAGAGVTPTVTCPAVSTVGDFDNYLDPGETLTCTASYTVVAGDVTAKLITNTAAASTAAVGGIPGATSNTASNMILLAPDLIATKTNNVGGQVLPGGSFVWTLTVSNPVSAGTATFTNGQVLLIDDMPISGATYTTSATATNAGGTTGAIDCAIASNTLTCAANGSVVLPPGGSFSELVTAATTTAGSLVNPKSGGLCKADPSNVLIEIDETNNACADTVTVRALPSLTVVKSVQTYSDPANGTTGPKAIPGAVMLYTVIVTNSGAGLVDNNTTVVTDPIPANTALFVGDLNGAGSGPVLFTDGSVGSGLSYSFINLGSGADNISFSNNGGTTYAYTPIPDADGFDANVTNFKVSLSGAFNGASGGNNPSFNLKFRVKVK